MFLRNENNSCYINSFFNVLYEAFDDKLDKLFKNSKNNVGKRLKNEILSRNVRNIRQIFSCESKDNSWLYEQKEPLDVVLELHKFFNIPDTCFIREYTFDKNEDLTKIKSYRQSFMCKFINSTINCEISDVDVDYIDKCKRICRIKSYSMLQFHINRNIGNKKSFHKIKAPLKLLTGNLVAIIVHKGNHFDSGHYISYIKDGLQWRLYDDMCSGYKIIKGLDQEIFKNCTDLFYK